MKAARTSETLVNFYQTTRRYNSEDSHLPDIKLLAPAIRGSCLFNAEKEHRPTAEQIAWSSVQTVQFFLRNTLSGIYVNIPVTNVK
jgi:hypothetical protein